MRGGEILKRRTVALVLAFAVLLAIPVFAATSRRLSNYPNLSFSGTRANCSVSVIAENQTDRLVVNMRLKHGTAIVGEWNGNGYGSVDLSGTANVMRNETYTLTVYVTVNGLAQQPVSITKTNN